MPAEQPEQQPEQQPMGRGIHQGRHVPEQEGQPEPAAPQRLRRTPDGRWVFVTFRGLDSKSTQIAPGALNLDEVRTLRWDEGNGWTVVEFKGATPDDDGTKVLEPLDAILGLS